MGLFDGDNKIYSFAYFFLTATYLIPIGLAIRYKLQTTNTATFWGKTFVVFLLIGCLVRLSNWICQPFIHANLLVVNNFQNFYWGIAPSYFFSSSYMVILFMWYVFSNYN